MIKSKSISDQNLFEWIKSNDTKLTPKAWDYIYRHYYPIVTKYVLRNNGNNEEAEDIFQDSLLILNRNIQNDTFKRESVVKTYLVGIAKNLWLKKLRDEGKKVKISLEGDYVEPENETYITNTKLLHDLISLLSEDCRRILTNFYFHKKNMSEIKAIFNLNSDQAARTKKYRCLTKLIAHFKSKKVNYHQFLSDGE